MKGGDAKLYKSAYKGGEYMNMQDLLLLHIDREYNRLGDYGNTLLSIKHKNDYTKAQFQSTVMFTKLATEYEDITERLNSLNFIVLNSSANKELLKNCIEYVNEASFTIMHFIVKVKEYEHITKSY